jgi:ATP-binding cassette subfamily E protein 1
MYLKLAPLLHFVRIVVVDQDKCQPKKCSHECFKYCPIVKSGEPDIIQIAEKAVIDESMCIGCGICTRVCPFHAISVVNLPEAVGEPVHRYGPNQFALFGLPIPGESVGILGPNGTGKTTILQIYSGQLVPNLGGDNTDWDPVVERFAGTEIGGYLKKLASGKFRVSYKPQNITGLAKLHKGKVGELLEKVDERGKLAGILDAVGLQYILKKKLNELSGGELQRVAIAATLAKDADVYFLDEPGSFLDIYERLRVSRAIREFAPRVFVVEHDLVMLDYLADNIHVTYGPPGVYGAISMRKGVRVGINEFLEGYLKAENVRIRPEPLKFVQAAQAVTSEGELVSYSDIEVKLGSFRLSMAAGRINAREIIGVVGRNALGKTTFIKVLAGMIKPESGKVSRELRVSYKPQYIEAQDAIVGELFKAVELPEGMNLNRDILSPLSLTHLLDRNVKGLSGGELQRVAVGLALARDADIYLLDEPSAFLDSEQRLKLAKLVKRLMQNSGKSAIVVEHDMMFVNYLSDRMMVFVGDPGVHGEVIGPIEVAEGMNSFLESVGITLRRDPQSKRPRVNKAGSQKDKEQRAKGQWYADD